MCYGSLNEESASQMFRPGNGLEDQSLDEANGNDDHREGTLITQGQLSQVPNPEDI